MHPNARLLFLHQGLADVEWGKTSAGIGELFLVGYGADALPLQLVVLFSEILQYEDEQ